ncbi:hypothetical protein N0V86_001052 [Didymella sp. IMI 355093]|nr:hypothetical protein N0V86_001052 [Didymella sp. IMI 355093]
MGDHRKEDRDRWSSPDNILDEDADFQYAMKLSAELNGELGGQAEAAAAAAKRLVQYEDDFDMALRVQSNDRKAESNGDPSSYPQNNVDTSRLIPERRKGAKSSDVTIVEPESSAGRTFDTVSSFSDYIQASACTKCGERFFTSESDVTKLFQDWYDGKGTLSSLLKCKLCDTSSCIACPSTALSRRSLAVTQNKSVSWCCHNGRLLLIWILLCGFDILYCEMKVKNATEAEVQKQKFETPPKAEGQGKGKAKASQPNQHGGIGYGGIDDYGYHGWGDSFGNYSPEKLPPGFYSNKAKSPISAMSYWVDLGPGRTVSDQKSQAFDRQQAMDKLGATVFHLLQYLLPSLERGHSFDLTPPLVVTEMLLESKLLDYCSELLGDNSIDDAFSRETTFEALLDFVKVIGSHHATANSTVFLGKPKRPDLCNLLTQTYRNVRYSPNGLVPPIADSLRELSKLSSLLLKNTEHHKTIYAAGDDRKMLSLCRKISDLWSHLSVHILLPAAEALPDASATGVAAISDVTDRQICTSHAFSTQAQAQFRSAPGRLKRLVSEINILKTSLPPGVFVRHGESRLDVIKFVIIGPEGSPYENGIWEFDMYCPPEYPNVPPMVSFKTTGRGRHGLNPNLYPDGKVCLSLLGTWPGEPWKSGQSTLLQVLVSLQAMVFCEQPWYNEPGRERGLASGAADPTAERYNREIRELTVRLGMLDWLENTPQIWRNVVEQHFKFSADKMLCTVIDWSKKPRRPVLPSEMLFIEYGIGNHESGYKETLPRLHGLLQKYGATVALPDIREPDPEPRPKRARVESSQGPTLGSGYGTDFVTEIETALKAEMDDLEDMDDPEDVYNQFGPLEGALPGFGGSRGRGAHGGSYNFRGRGQVLGAGPEDPAPPAPSTLPPPGASNRGRGRGRGGSGSFESLLAGLGRGRGRGRGTDTPYDPSASIQDLMYGKGRRLGDSEDKTDGGGGRGGGSLPGFGRGHRGGRGGPGGDGSPTV